MSREYDLYLQKHKNNVMEGFKWIHSNLPDLLIAMPGVDYAWQIANHDRSKGFSDEYGAYDRYFYGNNRSYEVVRDYNKAWLMHIHRNPHHWQHWVLINDDPNEGEIALDMPYNDIIEMICDWWAFSWNSGNLTEIFSWYNEHKAYMKLSEYTRETVENILFKLKTAIELKEV